MSHTANDVGGETSHAVEFTARGERFRMVRANQGLLDIGVYQLEALSPGADSLLFEEEAHEAVELVRIPTPAVGLVRRDKSVPHHPARDDLERGLALREPRLEPAPLRLDFILELSSRVEIGGVKGGKTTVFDYQ